MTAGARSGLDKLFEEFRERIEFVSIYVREAHPGEKYSHHTSMDQKLQAARDWERDDRVPWTVAVDELDGSTHKAYGGTPNSAYIIDRTGHVAFRALWAGQEGLLRKRMQKIVELENEGQESITLDQQNNLLIPMIKGGAEFDRVIARGGKKAQEDFKRELGSAIYGFQKIASKLKPLIGGSRK